MRSSYWSSSRFGQWLCGTAKPISHTWEGWDEWHDTARKRHPFRYWLAETVLDKLQDIAYLPVDIPRSISIYCHNRFVWKTHFLPTGLDRGCWYDTDTRLLHGVFETLVQYVEQELTLERLNWEIDLKDDDGKPTHQAESAAEIKELYLWWKAYPNRPDPFDSEGVSCKPEDRDALMAAGRAEELLHEDDDRQLCRVIKLRRSMWT